MISTPGHRVPRRRQRGTLPAWSQFGLSPTPVRSGQTFLLSAQGRRDRFTTRMLERRRSKCSARPSKFAEDLVAYLVSREDRPWPEWGKTRKPISKVQLARILKPFRISPGTVRLDDGITAKGYHKSAFEDAFARLFARRRRRSAARLSSPAPSSAIDAGSGTAAASSVITTSPLPIRKSATRI
jgi:Protein of unknown function (DUF3631)